MADFEIKKKYYHKKYLYIIGYLTLCIATLLLIVSLIFFFIPIYLFFTIIFIIGLISLTVSVNPSFIRISNGVFNDEYVILPFCEKGMMIKNNSLSLSNKLRYDEIEAIEIDKIQDYIKIYSNRFVKPDAVKKTNNLLIYLNDPLEIIIFTSKGDYHYLGPISNEFKRFVIRLDEQIKSS